MVKQIRIKISDGFVWADYEAALREIFAMGRTIEIVWDVRRMTRFPWEHVTKQIVLMTQFPKEAQAHIKQNTILLPNDKWKKATQVVLRLLPPTTPVKLEVRPVPSAFPNTKVQVCSRRNDSSSEG